MMTRTTPKATAGDPNDDYARQRERWDVYVRAFQRFMAKPLPEEVGTPGSAPTPA